MYIFIDVDGVSHQIDLVSLINLILQYGQTRSLLNQ